VRYVGATPVFADVAGPLEPWLSAAACRRALGPRTRAIVGMPYGGHPGEVRDLEALAADAGVDLLLDAAHAVGACVDGRPLAGVGRAAAYSFFANKNLAVGEGGMVATDDEALAARVRLLRSHAMTSVSWDRAQGHASDYDVVALGFNYRLDEPRAALGRARLQHFDEEQARRADLDARYREHLGDVACALAPVPGAASAHHLFTIVLDEDVDRRAFRERLAARGVQTSMHYPPVHRFAVYADDALDLPVTDDYAARAVTLPLFAHLGTGQQDLVLAAVRDALSARSPRVGAA
jgi:dTDP-4-amino-4,6-dideoxygalactose transaminase